MKGGEEIRNMHAPFDLFLWWTGVIAKTEKRRKSKEKIYIVSSQSLFLRAIMVFFYFAKFFASFNCESWTFSDSLADCDSNAGGELVYKQQGANTMCFVCPSCLLRMRSPPSALVNASLERRTRGDDKLLFVIIRTWDTVYDNYYQTRKT